MNPSSIDFNTATPEEIHKFLTGLPVGTEKDVIYGLMKIVPTDKTMELMKLTIEHLHTCVDKLQKALEETGVSDKGPELV